MSTAEAFRQSGTEIPELFFIASFAYKNDTLSNTSDMIVSTVSADTEIFEIDDLAKFIEKLLFNEENTNTSKSDKATAIAIINNGYLFDSGKAEIRDKQAEDGLKAIAKVLKKHEDKLKRVTIQSHSDIIPISLEAFSDNLALTSKQASNVAQFLSEAGDLDPVLFDSVGKGEFSPIASNDTAEGRQQNRRLEILIECKG